MKQSFHKPAVGLLLAALASYSLAAGCNPSSRYRVLSTVFDNVPPPGATPRPRRPVHVRRQLPDRMAKAKPTPIPTAAPTPAGPPIERVKEWDKAADLLPKDAFGNPDFMAGLKQGVIKPRSSIGGDMTPPKIMPLDVELIPEGKPQLKVIFPHASHTQWLHCPACHPDVFQMQAGADKITMGAIFNGEFCGKCHGKVAFDLMSCARCHVDLGKP